MTSGVFIDLVGKVFGRLVVVSRSDSHITPNGTLKPYWECKCSCGAAVRVRAETLRNGDTRSCGCLAKELSSINHSTHGQSKSTTYNTWRAMIERCNRKGNSHYKHYGERGITVCKDWLKYENFLRDMGTRPDGLSIERVNNDLGYSKENCRWATAVEQSRNTTRSVLIEWDGATRNRCDWAKIIGITPEALAVRIRKWGLNRAMTTPNQYPLSRREKMNDN